MARPCKTAHVGKFSQHTKIELFRRREYLLSLSLIVRRLNPLRISDDIGNIIIGTGIPFRNMLSVSSYRFGPFVDELTTETRWTGKFRRQRCLYMVISTFKLGILHSQDF